MNILDSKLYKLDIEKSLSQIVNLNKLNRSRILVTGATGLVCSAIIDLLLHTKLQHTIYAAGRNEKKVHDRFGMSVEFIPYDATKPLTFDVDVDYIIHGASNASPDLYVNEPVETMQANMNGMQYLLEFARKKSVKKVIFISSSEVYGRKENIEPFLENQYGYVDLLAPRSSYAISKRAAETICAAYQAEYGVNFNIVRPGHIYGPSASASDQRVSSDFAYKAAHGINLILKSEGKQMRSYCYSLDCASAILSVLTSGACGEAYNISNKNSIIDIRTMAKYIAASGGVQLLFDVPEQIEAAAFNPMDNSSLNSDKIEKLGWHGLFTAQEGLNHTVQILREIYNN